MGQLGTFASVVTLEFTLVLRLVTSIAATNFSLKSNLLRTLFVILSRDGRWIYPEIQPGTARRHTGSVSLVFSKLSFGKWLGISSKLTLSTFTLYGVCHTRRDHFASLFYSRMFLPLSCSYFLLKLTSLSVAIVKPFGLEIKSWLKYCSLWW